MTRSERPQRFLLVVAAAPILALAFLHGLGCGPNDEVSGVWRTFETLPLEVTGEADSLCYLADRPYVTLVLGQYGYDVAGVIKLYQDPSFSDDVPCCTPIFQGRLRGDTLKFGFKACSSGLEPNDGGPDPNWFRAELTLEPDRASPRLAGTIFVGNATDPYGTLELEGKQEEEASADLKRCNVDAPCGLTAGTTAAAATAATVPGAAGGAGGGDGARP